MRFTDAQRRLLKVIDDFAEPGEGWGEVQLQFIERSPRLPKNLEGSTFQKVFAALVARGLCSTPPNISDGPVLTPKGERLMHDHGRINWTESGRVVFGGAS